MQVDRRVRRYRGNDAAQEDIFNGINAGQLLVNYLGHGSEEQWSGSDIFDDYAVSIADEQFATARLPDHGLFERILPGRLCATAGVTLLLAPNGGGVGGAGFQRPESGRPPQVKLSTLWSCKML